MGQIAHGSKVTMHLSLSLPDGTEALSTFGEDPLQFTMGDSTLQPDMEYALFGLKPGDEQTLTLTAEQAYGPHDENLIQQVPRNSFPDSMEPERGQIVAFTTEDGGEAPGLILAVTDQYVEVDFNHPLSGKEIVYRVQILQVENT